MASTRKGSNSYLHNSCQGGLKFVIYIVPTLQGPIYAIDRVPSTYYSHKAIIKMAKKYSTGFMLAFNQHNLSLGRALGTVLETLAPHQGGGGGWYRQTYRDYVSIYE